MMPIKAFGLAAVLCVLFVPEAPCAATAAKSTAVHSRAQTRLVIAGWIPDWAKASGIPEAMAHLPQLSEVSPFAYEVGENGTLRDAMRLDTSPWAELVAAARSRKVKIIPTITWFHGKAIHATLAVPAARQAHVQAIVALTIRNNFDGIDINYEAKLIDSKSYFSQFITELGTALHAQKKLLMCTIEPRTPPSALSTIVPKNMEDANDYRVLNRYCDAVRIMTYDQTTVDLDLNTVKGTAQLYTPVADTDWVKKVITLAVQTLAPKKMMLGIATYGYEYLYNPKHADEPLRKLRSLSHMEALRLAAANGTVPARNNAGELSFQYRQQGTLRYVSWSDAGAVGAKVKLAKALKVRGVAVFKIDGETDPGMWKVLK
jgi:spore germination protein